MIGDERTSGNYSSDIVGLRLLRRVVVGGVANVGVVVALDVGARVVGA